MAVSPKNKSRKSTGKNAKEVVEEVEEENASGEEEEESYEVEAILKAKWQHNMRGKWSYWVHWKGYPDEEDSWVDEDDAASAEELIAEFHEKHNLPRDGKGKKGPVKKPRPSAAKATTDKKRKAASADEMEVDTPEAEEPPAKKPARRGRPAKNAKQSPEPEVETEAEDDEEGELATMDEFMKKANWENIVESIETVEQSGKELVALIIRKDGIKSRCPTTILAERCPQMLIQFYETHLKWRPTDDD